MRIVRIRRRRRRDPHVTLEEAFVRGRRWLQAPLLGAVLVVLVGLVGLAVVLAWRQYDDGKRQALRETKARAILAATVFDTYFAGQVATLESIAGAPTVRSADVAGIASYLRRVHRTGGKGFTGGLGWVDRAGLVRATTTGLVPPALHVDDRSYFRAVVRTGRPFISEALVTKTRKRRVIVMAVPTRDGQGRLNGVLTGALWLRPSRTNKRAVDLGYAGLEVIDRKGHQLTLASLAKPRNKSLVARLDTQREGVIAGTRGLDGSGGRVVAYATSPLPGWKTVIDQPESAVFAAPRHSFLLEVTSISAAGALVLALLAWAVRRSRRQLRAERGRIARWSRFIRSLEEAATVDAVADELASALKSEVPQAVAVAVAVTADPAGRLELRALHVDGDLTLDEEPVLELLRSAHSSPEPVAIAKRRLAKNAPGVARHAALDGFFGTAIGEHENPLGAVGLLVREGWPVDGDQRVFVQALADQSTLALLRVLRSEHEHTTAITLQRSLLPQALSEVEAVAIAARYQAGDGKAEVGGDWYDVVRRADGRVHLTVGDVAGRGIPAAVLMGRLRNAFAAYALEYGSPGAIIGRLARHVEGGQMVTMCCVTFDPYTRELRYASAGHPPALLIDLDTRSMELLEGARRTPLGWGSPRALQDGTAELPGRALLVLYTDGVVERRGESISDGIDRLARAVLEQPLDGVELVAGRVLRQLGGHGADDDAALLLADVSRVPATVEIEILADPAALAPLRRRLRRWLALRELDAHADDVVLAIGEACNNGIEHGYAGSGGTISISLEHDAERLRITVADEGVWREPQPDPSRGRGLVIMEALMDGVALTHGLRGTTVVLDRLLGAPASAPPAEPATALG